MPCVVRGRFIDVALLGSLTLDAAKMQHASGSMSIIFVLRGSVFKVRQILCVAFCVAAVIAILN